MPNYKVTIPKRTLMGRLDHGADLLEQLTTICHQAEITAGRIQAIGALQSAQVGYYHQDTKEYENILFHQHMEIVSLVGNISTRDGEPVVHAHLAIADKQGKVYGGHLSEGNILFAGECIITELSSPKIERVLDPETGLYLWDF